jgi:hypothetical protein
MILSLLGITATIIVFTAGAIAIANLLINVIVEVIVWLNG